MTSLVPFYRSIAIEASKTCMTLSRYYDSKADHVESDKEGRTFSFKSCVFCSSRFKPGNHKIQLLSKMRLTPRVKRLLVRLEKDPETLGKYQKKLVQDYINSSNKLCIRCSVCRKTMTVTGQTRLHKQQLEEIRKQKETLAAETVIQPKSKAEKKKQKRKKLKQKRHEQGETDKFAGLTLPISSEPTASMPTDSSQNETTDTISVCVYQPSKQSADKKLSPRQITMYPSSQRDVVTTSSLNVPEPKTDYHVTTNKPNIAFRTTHAATASESPRVNDKKTMFDASKAQTVGSAITSNFNHVSEKTDGSKIIADTSKHTAGSTIPMNKMKMKQLPSSEKFKSSPRLEAQKSANKKALKKLKKANHAAEIKTKISTLSKILKKDKNKKPETSSLTDFLSNL